MTSFEVLPPHQVIWSIGLSVGVSFDQDGDITFISAGADFDI